MYDLRGEKKLCAETWNSEGGIFSSLVFQSSSSFPPPSLNATAQKSPVLNSLWHYPCCSSSSTLFDTTSFVRLSREHPKIEKQVTSPDSPKFNPNFFTSVADFSCFFASPSGPKKEHSLSTCSARSSVHTAKNEIKENEVEEYFFPDDFGGRVEASETNFTNHMSPFFFIAEEDISKRFSLFDTFSCSCYGKQEEECLAPRNLPPFSASSPNSFTLPENVTSIRHTTTEAYSINPSDSFSYSNSSFHFTLSTLSTLSYSRPSSAHSPFIRNSQNSCTFNKHPTCNNLLLAPKHASSGNRTLTNSSSSLFSTPFNNASSFPPRILTQHASNFSSLSSNLKNELDWKDLGIEEFNQRLFDDEAILNFCFIWQKELKPEIKEDIKSVGEEQSCIFELKWIIKGHIIKGIGFARSKKEAKKLAVRDLLKQLGKPPKSIYDQITLWTIKNLKNLIKAEAQSYNTHENNDVIHHLKWIINNDNNSPVEFESKGRGKTLQEAEIKAMQYMYTQVYQIKDKLLQNQAKLKAEAARKSISENVSERLSSANAAIPLISKTDISEINKRHNCLTMKFKIKTQENVICVGDAFRCTLEWTWKDVEGRTQHLTVKGLGLSKAHARAHAAQDMMVRTGLVDFIDPNNRNEAREIIELMKTDLSGAVNRGCALMSNTKCGVWSLFLTDLWKNVLAEGNLNYVERILTSLKAVTCQVENKRFLNPDLWESLLYECTVLANHEFGQTTLLQLGDLPLDEKCFPSEEALNYFSTYRLLLALDWHAQLANAILCKKDFCKLSDFKKILLQLKSVVLPILSFSGTFSVEERNLFLSLNIRENDYVLISRTDITFSDDKSSERCAVCAITSLKIDHNYQINIRLLSAESIKHYDVLSTSHMYLYPLSSTVTHDRMVSALRALTQHITPSSQSVPPYKFSPEMRYLLLHTFDTEAISVAQRGDVSFLADSICIRNHPFYSGKNEKKSQIEFDKKLLAKKNSDSKNELSMSTLIKDLTNQLNNKLSIDTSNLKSPLPHSYALKLSTDLPLNASQINACLSAMTNRLTVIQGPPGTGKTHVACAIIDCWQRCNPSKKILAVADSNVAADNLMEGLMKRKIRAVRVGFGSEIDIQEDAISDLPRYKEYLLLRKSGILKEAFACRMNLFRDAVKKHNIVIATCIGSGHEMFHDMNFQRVIIDECAQAIEPSTTIPIGMMCNNLVLIGDQKQLPPTILSKEASLRGLDVSLMERFVRSGIVDVHLLDEQRRMHPSIAEFPNMQFYQNKLKNFGVDDVTRPLIRGFSFLRESFRVCLVNVSSSLTPEDKNSQSFEQTYRTSKFNLVEIPPIVSILKSCIDSSSVTPNQVGILTPYDAQKVRLRKAINEALPAIISSQIEVDSVDGFQGKEKDLILFSSVRSNLKGDVGFLEDPRRMNVMLTRARRAIIVFGDRNTLLCEKSNWLAWVRYVESKNSVISYLDLKNYVESPSALKFLDESMEIYSSLSNLGK